MPTTRPSKEPAARDHSSDDLIALEDRYGANHYHPLDIVLERAEGVWVWDVEGRRFLDCLASYSALNQGHNHPVVVRALAEQSARLSLTSRAFRNDRLAPFQQQLAELAGFAKVLPMNTGAEAVETAIKAIRKWAYTVKGVPENQAEILVFENNFHGRTTTIVGFSSEPQYRHGFGPFAPGFTLSGGHVTGTFTTLVVCQWFNALNCRERFSLKSPFKLDVSKSTAPTPCSLKSAESRSNPSNSIFPPSKRTPPDTASNAVPSAARRPLRLRSVSSPNMPETCESVSRMSSPPIRPSWTSTRPCPVRLRTIDS